MTVVSVPPMGFDEQGVFVMPLRVYYEDTDAGGIVYHSIYLNYAERARTEFVRALGVSQQELLQSTGMAVAVVSCAAKFRSPARLDDALLVKTRLLAVRGASLQFEQKITRDETLLFDYEVQVACVSKDGRAVRFPPQMRALLNDVMASAANAG
jgi:acyl-CoA thioester hydrolase